MALVLVPGAASAHRLPPEVTALFTVDPGPPSRLRVAVRVPTAILLDAQLPRVDTVLLDLRTIDARLGPIAAEVARSLDVVEDDRSLVPAPPRVRVSAAGDRAFESFASAVAHLEGPALPPDRAVYWNEAYVDVLLEYPLGSPVARVGARLNGLRMGGAFFQTRATFQPAQGEPRTITVAGAPQRVQFEPGAGEAAALVAGRGVDILAGERMLWMFVVCVALAMSGSRAALVPAADGRHTPASRGLAAGVGLLACVLAAMAVVAARREAVAGTTQDLARFVAGAAVVLGAVRVLVGRNIGVVCASAAGLALGVTLGGHLHEVLPLAGAHAWLAIATLGVLVVSTSAGLLVLLRALVPLPYRWRAPAWLVTAGWCAWPAHEASHAMVEAAGRLAEEDPWRLPPVQAFVLARWPVLALLVFLGLMWTASRRQTGAPPVAQRSSP